MFWYLVGLTRNEMNIKERKVGLAGFQLGHFLHVDAYALWVKQHEVHRLDGGWHGGHEVGGDGLQDELSRRLLGKAVPGEGKQYVVIQGHIKSAHQSSQLSIRLWLENLWNRPLCWFSRHASRVCECV